MLASDLKSNLDYDNRLFNREIVIESMIKNFFINFADDRWDRYWMVICYIKFVFTFKYGQYFSSFERLGEDPSCKGLVYYIR